MIRRNSASVAAHKGRDGFSPEQRNGFNEEMRKENESAEKKRAPEKSESNNKYFSSGLLGRRGGSDVDVNMHNYSNFRVYGELYFGAV